MAKRSIIRKAIEKLNVDDKVNFLIAQLASVRVGASEVGLAMNRKYKTKSNSSDGVITVHRIA